MTKSKRIRMCFTCLIVLSAFILCVIDRARAQTCNFSVSPTSVTSTVNGLPDPNDPRGVTSQPPKITVTASEAECGWTASTNVSWIQLLSPGGSGSGYVQYRVMQNTTGSPRTGTMQVAGKTVTINQDSDTVCTVSVSPMGISVREQGAPEAPSDPRGATSAPPAKLTVTTSKGDCRWTATANASWITVLTRRGVGSGYIEYRVMQNTTGSPRTGTIEVEGKTVTINQEYTGTCTFSVSPASVSVAWHGTDSSDPRGATKSSSLKLTISSSKANCQWTATTSASWIQLLSPGGSGSGYVDYRVLNNATGSPRTGTIQVAGRTVRVKQDPEKAKGAPPSAGATKSKCKATLSPARATVESKGATGAFKVNTDDDCAWTAKTKTPWIHITSGASSKGGGTVQYRVDENKGAKRRGTISVSGKTFSISQKQALKRKSRKTMEKGSLLSDQVKAAD